MLFTSLVLAAGLGAMTLATTSNSRNFGILAARASLVAFVSDVLVAPALMTLFVRREKRPMRN